MLRPLRVLLALLSTAAPALGQESPAERVRRDLIDTAERARLEGDHARALEFGTRAGQVRMTPSLRLLIAQEHDALGHTLDALDAAERCAREAEADVAMRNRVAVLEACASLRDRLTAGVGSVTVRVDGSPTDASVLLDGHALAEPRWGIAIPVLPGPHRVIATAAGGRRFERSVQVTRGQGAELVVTFPPAQTPPALVAPSPPAAGRTSSGSVGVGPWIVAGAGVASFGAAALFWGLHAEAIAEREGACDATGCDPIAVSHDARARGFTTLTNVALGVGVAASVGAALWFVLAPRAASEPTPGRTAGARWGFTVLPSGAAVSVGGAL